jgi:hypothetical protein
MVEYLFELFIPLLYNIRKGITMAEAFVKNKDLLREIHLSKASYCYYLDPQYIDYHHIVQSVTEITPELIDQIVEQLANPPRKKNAITIAPENVVIRVMTNEHIPLKGKDVKSKKNSAPQVKHLFPAFKHYVLRDNTLVEVLRSHWVDGFDNGHFSIDHGKMTRTMAKMLVMLVEKYSLKGNWRGYSYIDEMRGQALVQLSQIALQFDESKSDNPFAYYTQTMKMCFTRVLNLEKKERNIRDDLLEWNRCPPSSTRQVENEMKAWKDGG